MKTIQYQAGETSCRGYLARDADIGGQVPGVIVVHEWWGLNDYIRGRADMLAKEGFCAFAIDMYGEGKTADNPEQAGEAMNAVLGDMDAGTERLKAAYEALVAQTAVDASRTAAIGYVSVAPWFCTWPGSVCLYRQWQAFMARWDLSTSQVRVRSGQRCWFVMARTMRWFQWMTCRNSREEMNAAEANYEWLYIRVLATGYQSGC